MILFSFCLKVIRDKTNLYLVFILTKALPFNILKRMSRKLQPELFLRFSLLYPYKARLFRVTFPVIPSTKRKFNKRTTLRHRNWNSFTGFKRGFYWRHALCKLAIRCDKCLCVMSVAPDRSRLR